MFAFWPHPLFERLPPQRFRRQTFKHQPVFALPLLVAMLCGTAVLTLVALSPWNTSSSWEHRECMGGARRKKWLMLCRSLQAGSQKRLESKCGG